MPHGPYFGEELQSRKLAGVRNAKTVKRTENGSNDIAQ